MGYLFWGGLLAAAALLLLAAVVVFIIVVQKPPPPAKVDDNQKKDDDDAIQPLQQAPPRAAHATRTAEIVSFRTAPEETSSSLRLRSSATATTPPERKSSILSTLTRGVLSHRHSSAGEEGTPPTSPKSVTFGDATPPASPPHNEIKQLHPFNSLDGHFDSVESLAFSQEEGYFCTGGGPEDGFIRFYEKKHTRDLDVGPLRHIINVKADCGKFDTASSLSFTLDEGRKSTLLLVGTKTERFLMGYRISRSANTVPMLMFCFPTNHGSPVSSVAGFIPKSAINYSDHGVFFATSALGTREVKLWTLRRGGSSPVLVIDTECWAAQLRISPNGRYLAVLSKGGGAGQMYELKFDQKTGAIKATRLKLSVPITAATPVPVSAALPRLAKSSEFQYCQDLRFSGERCTVACCRNDSTIWIGSVQEVGSASEWDIQVLLKPECLLGTPSQLVVLVQSELRRTKLLVAKGKDLYFFDHTLSPLGVLRGRREDGDVIGMELSPTEDLVIVVSFGGSVARVINVM